MASIWLARKYYCVTPGVSSESQPWWLWITACLGYTEYSVQPDPYLRSTGFRRTVIWIINTPGCVLMFRASSCPAIPCEETMWNTSSSHWALLQPGKASLNTLGRVVTTVDQALVQSIMPGGSFFFCWTWLLDGKSSHKVQFLDAVNGMAIYPENPASAEIISSS